MLILDEPTNDLDTDMLAAMEDLLDSWPGTLIVVSHDRYFLERVTDKQFAILDARLRHLPGGVDEYLRLRALQDAAPTSSAGSAAAGPASGLSGADLRTAKKEVAALERRIGKVQGEVDAARAALAEHDHADYEGLAAQMARDHGRRDGRRGHGGALVRADGGDRLSAAAVVSGRRTPAGR